MTYIFGFIAKETVFLISDTTTTNCKAVGEIPSSSFGEFPFISQNKTVYQSELKLFNLKEKIIVGGAGISSSIDSFVENLETYLNYGMKIQDSIEKALSENIYKDFNLLLGFIDEGEPCLYKTVCDLSKIEKCTEGFSSIGQHETHHVLFKNDFLDLKKETDSFNRLKSSEISVLVTSALQSYGLWKYTLSEGVGGAFTCIYLNKESVNWQPSIGFITFNLNLFALSSSESNPENLQPENLFLNSKLIFMAERDNVFYISAPEPNFTGFLFRELDNKKDGLIETWKENHEGSLLKQFTNLEVDYLVFVCIETKVICLYKKEKFKSSGLRILNRDGYSEIGLDQNLNFEKFDEFKKRLYKPETTDINEITLKFEF